VSQVQESAEVAAGQDRLAGYELHDLVILSGGGSSNEVGVIVRVGREEFSIINNHGIVREVRPEELRGKRNSSSSRSVALDLQGNQIRVGDTVSVTEGPHKGKTATIKRMTRAHLFLYSQTRTENAGIFVVRSRSCVLSGSNAQTRKSIDVGSSPFSTPQSQQRGAVGGAVRGRQSDGIIGKTVRIQAGNWKGYLGAVADATPTHVQVELHSRLKKVMVLRDRVVVVGDKYGATEDADRLNTNVMLAPTTPFLGGATPMHGGATPMHGGATPMYGGATPMYGQMSAGLATPLHQSGDNDDVWRPGGVIDRGGETVSHNDDLGWGSSNASAQNNSSLSGDGGWGSLPSNQNDSTWMPPSNEDVNTNNVTLNDKVPKEETEFDNFGASTMGTDDGQQAPVWFMERVYVQLKNDKIAVIKDVTGNKAVVELEDKSSQSVSCSECIMVPPKENDTVLVTGGADVGVEGELVCIDGSDAILRDANGDFKIVDLVHIAKIDSES
jgi:transcription elongation factor SPT5